MIVFLGNRLLLLLRILVPSGSSIKVVSELALATFVTTVCLTIKESEAVRFVGAILRHHNHAYTLQLLRLITLISRRNEPLCRDLLLLVIRLHALLLALIL